MSLVFAHLTPRLDSSVGLLTAVVLMDSFNAGLQSFHLLSVLMSDFVGKLNV